MSMTREEIDAKTTDILTRLAEQVPGLSQEQIDKLQSLMQTIEYVGIDDIRPSGNEARKNEAAIPKVAASIRELGFRSPIYVDGTGEIITGHTRFFAAKLLGLTKVPVVKVTDLSYSQIRLLKLADNKVAEFSSWDFTELDKELAELKVELPDFDFGDIGLASFDENGLPGENGLPPELAGKDLTPDELPDKGGEVATGGRIIIVFDEERRHELEELLGVKELPKETVTYMLDDIVKMRAASEDAEG